MNYVLRIADSLDPRQLTWARKDGKDYITCQCGTKHYVSRKGFEKYRRIECQCGKWFIPCGIPLPDERPSRPWRPSR